MASEEAANSELSASSWRQQFLKIFLDSLEGPWNLQRRLLLHADTE